MEYCNENRCVRAHEVLARYSGLKEISTSEMSDLIADLMHLADREGWDFSSILLMAEIHFDDEKALEEAEHDTATV